MGVKTSTINVINNSESSGRYVASIEPANIFTLDHSEFEIRGK